MCYFALLAHDYCKSIKKFVHLESIGKSTHCTSIENIYLQLSFINMFLLIGHFSVVTLREMNYLCVKMREIVRLLMLIESNAQHADMPLVLGKFHTISKSYFHQFIKIILCTAAQSYCYPAVQTGLFFFYFKTKTCNSCK